MASSVPTTAEDELMMADGGSLTRRTKLDRDRDYKYFTTFLQSKTQVTVGEFLAEGGDLNEFQDHLLKFFFSRRVEQEGRSLRPKQSYADKLKRSIKGKILTDYNVNIYELPKFTVFNTGWAGFCKTLLKEGRAEVEHFQEIPARCLQKISRLLHDCVRVIKARGTADYDEMLVNIPDDFKNQLNRLLQYGAQFELTRFGCRRGRENIADFKKVDIQMQEDPVYDFKYYRVVKAEGDKNHRKTPTSVKDGGVIPFLAMDEEGYNPGELMELYLSFVPDMATMEGKIDGKLFVRPRVASTKLNFRKADEFNWYCENVPGSFSSSDLGSSLIS